MLGEKIEKAQQNQKWTFDFSHGDSSRTIDPDMQLQLQSHGFDFSQPLGASASPHSGSITSDASYHSAAQNQLRPAANRSPFFHQSENWAQPQQVSQQIQGQNIMWDSALQSSPGPGFNMTQELFNQLQGFNQDMSAFGMDMPLDSGHFDSEWADEPSSTNQLTNLSPVISWQQAPNGPFNP